MKRRTALISLAGLFFIVLTMAILANPNWVFPQGGLGPVLTQTQEEILAQEINTTRWMFGICLALLTSLMIGVNLLLLGLLDIFLPKERRPLFRFSTKRPVMPSH